MLTTMTLKRLASLGGSDDPMAAAGAARRDAAARTLGRGEEGEGFWGARWRLGCVMEGVEARGRFGRKEPYPVCSVAGRKADLQRILRFCW